MYTQGNITFFPGNVRNLLFNVNYHRFLIKQNKVNGISKLRTFGKEITIDGNLATCIYIYINKIIIYDQYI